MQAALDMRHRSWPNVLQKADLATAGFPIASRGGQVRPFGMTAPDPGIEAGIRAKKGPRVQGSPSAPVDLIGRIGPPRRGRDY